VTVPTVATMHAADGRSRARSILAAHLRAHPIIGFFLLAYAFSWLAQLLCLALFGQPPVVAVFAATLGPTFAAIVTREALEGPAGGRHSRLWRVMRGVRIWRVGWRWYAVALLGVPAVYFALTLLLPGAALQVQPPMPLVIGYLVVLVVGAFSGPVFEEPGWRGFALPRLQARLGPAAGTLVLGVLWGAWHLPQFLIPAWASANGGFSLTSVGVFLLTVVSIAVLLTWVYNHARGSLLLVMLAHASVNAAQAGLVNPLVPAAANSNVSALFAFGLVAVGLLLLTRGRLGYSASPQLARAER
jgi:membrane protease YdiL (CAAX protease family)